jgi:hypothetical protein
MVFVPIVKSASVSFELKKNVPLATYRRYNSSKAVPLVLMSCPRNLPCVFFFANRNSGLLTVHLLASSVSAYACITKRKRIGAMLLPCCMPTVYETNRFSFPICRVTLTEVYNCWIALASLGGTTYCSSNANSSL